jgi:DNA-binding transcriptional MerR regulator
MSSFPHDKVARLASVTRISLTEVRRYERAGCLVIEQHEEVSERELRRLRRVRRLRRDLGFDLDAIGVIVRLVERVEELQSR